MQLLNCWIQNCLLDYLCGLCSSFSFFGFNCRSDFTLFFNSLVSVHLEHVKEFSLPSWIVNADVADSQIASVKWLIHCFIERERRKKKGKLFVSHKWTMKPQQCCHSIEMYYFYYILVFATFGIYSRSVVMISPHERSAGRGGNMQLCIPCEMRTEGGLHWMPEYRICGLYSCRAPH